jgi:tripartite-type tricarboxylate transporter receptor subunit TctC
MKSISRFAALAVMLAAALAQSAAIAQNYPSKAVRIYTPWVVGGPGDLVTRASAQELGQVLGEPFVVDARVGADGIIAAEAATKSPPDGHTLLGCDQQIVAINPALRSKLPYDARLLTPVIHFGFLAAALHVLPSVPVKNLQELLDMVKAKPDAITWGSFGLASAPHLYIEWLKNVKGIRFQNIPYKGATLAWQALLAGEVQMAYYAVGPAAAMLKAGKIKTLAVMLDKRSSHLPDIPTYKEAGLDIPLVTTWFALCAPPGMRKEIAQRLNTEILARVINNEAIKAKVMTSQGLEVITPAGGPPEAFGAFMAAERDKYVQLVKITGVETQ